MLPSIINSINSIKTLPKHSACVLPLISIKDFNDLSLNMLKNEQNLSFKLDIMKQHTT